MDNAQAYLTEEGLKKVKEELDYLVNTKRHEVADRIESAKELGDLSENAEYSDAKDEQAFLEGRVAELTSLVRNAVIIEKTAKNSNGQICVGSTIEVEDDKGGKKTYKIVGSQEADPAAGLISNESPIGRAFIGKKIGETAEFQAPRGVVSFKIICIK